MFCTKCGQKLANEAAYCSACGAIVEKSVAADQGSRKQVYVGEIRKCPNCGEALSAFEVKCHACGFELQNIAGSKAVVELAEAIAALEANRPPQLQTKKICTNSLIYPQHQQIEALQILYRALLFQTLKKIYWSL